MALVSTEEAVSDDWNTGLAYVTDESGLRVTPVRHGELVALAFQLSYEGRIAQASTILRDGQTLVMRLPAANTQTGWPVLALIKPMIVRRDVGGVVPGVEPGVGE